MTVPVQRNLHIVTDREGSFPSKNCAPYENYSRFIAIFQQGKICISKAYKGETKAHAVLQALLSFQAARAIDKHIQ